MLKPRTSIDRPQHRADQIAMLRHNRSLGRRIDDCLQRGYCPISRPAANRRCLIYTSSPQTKVLDDASGLHTKAFGQTASTVFLTNRKR